MHSILFAIKKPSDNEHIQYAKWQTAVNNLANKANKNKGTQLLGEGILLLHPIDGLPLLGHALYEAETRALSYKVLYIEKGDERNYSP